MQLSMQTGDKITRTSDKPAPSRGSYGRWCLIVELADKNGRIFEQFAYFWKKTEALQFIKDHQ